MSLLWPDSLYLLLLIPLLAAGYIILLRRRRRFTIRYSSLSLVRESAGSQSWLRRHLPFLLFLLAIISLILALARPSATVVIPSNRATIILAMDVSLSMCSTDIPPNRLQASKDAALSFVQSRDPGTMIGIVAFAGFPELIQPPTNDKESLSNAVRNLTVARRTAIGSAILRSIEAISEVDASVPSISLNEGDTFTPATDYSPHIIVLLTDGSSNAGPPPLIAADEASRRGIRVYTIGFGTIHNNSPLNCGFSFSENDPFGFPGGQGFGFGAPFQGGGGGGGFRRELDEATLQQIADMTGGSYHAAASAGELQNVFQNLPTYLVITRETIEVSVLFNALAVLFMILAVFLSLRWNPLV